MEKFADSLDNAAVEQERALQQSIRDQLAKKQDSVLPLIGECYNCAEPLDGKRFCDADCRDDYQARLRSRKASGR